MPTATFTNLAQVSPVLFSALVEVERVTDGGGAEVDAAVAELRAALDTPNAVRVVAVSQRLDRLFCAAGGAADAAQARARARLHAATHRRR